MIRQLILRPVARLMVGFVVLASTVYVLGVPIAQAEETALPSPPVTQMVVASDDGVAVATLAPGAVPEDAACSVTIASTRQGESDTMLAGPYVLTCQTVGGSPIVPAQPVSWELRLKDRIQGYHDIRAAESDRDSTQTTIATSGRYDKAGETLKLEATADRQVAVMGTPQGYKWVFYIAGALLGLGLLAALAFMPLPFLRRGSYQDYIRTKYYDL